MTKHTFRFKTSLINIPRGAGKENWKRAFRLAMGDATSVVGVNESFSRDQRKVYKSIQKGEGWGVSRLGSPNPIFFDKAAWTFVRSRRIRLHDENKGRLANLWPGYNSSREATLTILKHRDSKEIVEFINFHLVAWGPKVNKAWRRRMIERSGRKLSRLANNAHKRGHLAIFMGDTNDPLETLKVERVYWLFDNVDRIGYVGPEGGYVSWKASSFKAPIDHKKGVRATFDFAYAL